MRHSYPASERAAAIEALRLSIPPGDSEPAWRQTERDTGIPRETLRRWWTDEIQPKRRAQIVALPTPAPGPAEAVPRFDPLTATEIDYWIWRWYQVQTLIPELTADAARVKLLDSQDQVWRELRAAVERERDTRGLSPEEVRIALLQSAEGVPLSFALEVIEVFRKRGIVA